jgi:hypothetical protein
MAEAFQASTQRSCDKTAAKQNAKPFADRKNCNETHRVAKAKLKAKREDEKRHNTASES